MASGPSVDLLSQSALDSNSFRIYCYKVVPCAKKFGHDWSECPFAHEGEKATRRCPALYRYSSIVCPDTRRSKACPRGDVCPYSHSIFEYWMHPARFRAQLCSFGTDCNRRICFFAHTQEQLRIPSEPAAADAVASRAPYLQGRVAPESRYALYPEQVPSLGAVAGRAIAAPQPTLVGQDMAGGMQGMPQMVYMAGAAPQAVALPGQAAALPAGQQWAAAPGVSSNIMIVPAGQAGAASGGMGYYVQAGAAAAGAGGQNYSTGMIVAAPGMQVLGGSYAGGQAVQLMAMPGDGGMPAYPIAAGGMPGAQMAYAPVYPSGGMAMQQWTAADQPQQQHPSQQQQLQQQPQLLHSMQPCQQQGLQPALQLMVQEDAVATHAPRPEAGAYILAPAGQMGQGRSQLEAPYTLMHPTGVVQGNPGLMAQPGARSSLTGGGQGGVDSAGAPGVDDLAQQMAGWGIQ